MNLDWIAEFLGLSEEAVNVLEKVFFGNTVLQYGLYAAVLLAAFAVSFVASFLVRKGLGRGLRRFDPKVLERVTEAIRRPIRVLTFTAVADLGSMILTHEPTPEDPRAHWAHLGAYSFFQVGLRLSAFWVLARLVALGWYEYLYPLIDRKIEGEEKRFFPVLYKLIATTIWIFAFVECVPVFGYDAVQLVFDMLAAEALGNSIGQYLAFLGLSLLTLLLARTVFNQLHRYVFKIARQRADAEGGFRFEEQWFDGFERPLIYLITLLGLRTAAAVLTADGVEVGVHTIVTIAIDVCLTLDVTWIFFILTDKVYEHFVVPLASAKEGLLDDALLPLIRKTAKAGIGGMGAIFMIKAFGQDPATVLAGLGIGGVAIGFAAKDTLAPFISGIAIFLTRPYNVGDYIKINDIEGRVEDIGLRATILRTKMGTAFVVPNDRIINQPIENTMKSERAYDGLYLRIDIGTVPEKRDEAIGLFKKAVERTEFGHEPEIHFLEYGSDNLGLMLSYWVSDTTRFWDTRHEIMMWIDVELRKLGVEMSLPTSAINLGGYLPGGGTPTIAVRHVQ